MVQMNPHESEDSSDDDNNRIFTYSPEAAPSASTPSASLQGGHAPCNGSAAEPLGSENEKQSDYVTTGTVQVSKVSNSKGKRRRTKNFEVKNNIV